MGTPGFAVPCLDLLHQSNIEVSAVITAPDRQSGRGRKIKHSEIKEYALSNNIPILQPPNLKAAEFLSELKAIDADLFVVVAFRMLPKLVWDMPKFGTINLHASLLPNYRGAAPINWAIINGEKTTGVTTFFINENIDTGSIIDQRSIDIKSDENFESLHDKLSVIGSKLLLETVFNIKEDKTNAQEQVLTSALKEAPKLTKENTKLNFNLPAIELIHFINGLSPYPAAHSELVNNELASNVKFYKAKLATEILDLEPGKIKTNHKNECLIGCGQGAISVLELQLQGKKRMKISDLLNGYQLNNEALFH